MMEARKRKRPPPSADAKRRAKANAFPCFVALELSLVNIAKPPPEI